MSSDRAEAVSSGASREALLWGSSAWGCCLWGCGSAGAQRWALGGQCKAGNGGEEVGESFQLGQEGLSDQGRHISVYHRAHT